MSRGPAGLLTCQCFIMSRNSICKAERKSESGMWDGPSRAQDECLPLSAHASYNLSLCASVFSLVSASRARASPRFSSTHMPRMVTTLRYKILCVSAALFASLYPCILDCLLKLLFYNVCMPWGPLEWVAHMLVIVPCTRKGLTILIQECGHLSFIGLTLMAASVLQA